MIQELFILGNAICAVGAALHIKRVWKNRKVLSDYSPFGSLLTSLACSVFATIYVIEGQIITLAFALPTLIFWWFVMFVSTIRKYKRK
jgi:hypothetical protein